ncbi:hypothetical protein QZJ86_19990 [Methylomonas montana]|uniref:hypothetical protein n=1 Tax=Methylomonas montana TaxID=3058963 RepID=UPI0026595630|nr:hypothetical protein [Methylomonas montana]WKJ90263.1 hypothetical protein QZJ86_19990 [Methylomonas montana]
MQELSLLLFSCSIALLKFFHSFTNMISILMTIADDATVSPEGSGFTGFALAHNVASEAEVEVEATLLEAVGLLAAN